MTSRKGDRACTVASRALADQYVALFVEHKDGYADARDHGRVRDGRL
jgi:hypothetical protein